MSRHGSPWAATRACDRCVRRSAERGSKLVRVVLHHESDQVAHPLAGGLHGDPQLQVLRAVVAANAVAMVDVLRRVQCPSDLAFHDDAVRRLAHLADGQIDVAGPGIDRPGVLPREIQVDDAIPCVDFAPVDGLHPVHRRLAAHRAGHVSRQGAVLVAVETLAATVRRAEIVPGDRIVRAVAHPAGTLAPPSASSLARVARLAPTAVVRGAVRASQDRLPASTDRARGLAAVLPAVAPRSSSVGTTFNSALVHVPYGTRTGSY